MGKTTTHARKKLLIDRSKRFLVAGCPERIERLEDVEESYRRVLHLRLIERSRHVAADILPLQSRRHARNLLKHLHLYVKQPRGPLAMARSGNLDGHMRGFGRSEERRVGKEC